MASAIYSESGVFELLRWDDIGESAVEDVANSPAKEFMVDSAGRVYGPDPDIIYLGSKC